MKPVLRRRLFFSALLSVGVPCRLVHLGRRRPGHTSSPTAPDASDAPHAARPATPATASSASARPSAAAPCSTGPAADAPRSGPAALLAASRRWRRWRSVDVAARRRQPASSNGSPNAGAGRQAPAHQATTKPGAVHRLHFSRNWISRTGPRRSRRTMLVFRLGQAAPVEFMVVQVAPDCRRIGRFRVAGHPGVNRVRFRGHIGGRALDPGTYRIKARTLPRGTRRRRHEVRRRRASRTASDRVLPRRGCLRLEAGFAGGRAPPVQRLRTWDAEGGSSTGPSQGREPQTALPCPWRPRSQVRAGCGRRFQDHSELALRPPRDRDRAPRGRRAAIAAGADPASGHDSRAAQGRGRAGRDRLVDRGARRDDCRLRPGLSGADGVELAADGEPLERLASRSGARARA